MTHKLALVNLSNWPNDYFMVDSPGHEERSGVLYPGGVLEIGTNDAFVLNVTPTEDPDGEKGYRPLELEVRRVIERGHDEPNRMLKWFSYEHLPQDLQPVSKLLAEAAERLDTMLPECAEKTAGLRKLLEGKDALVRAAIKAAARTGVPSPPPA